MTAIRARINKQGRLVIPAELRAAAGIEPGSDVVVEVCDGDVRVRSTQAALARVQRKYRELAGKRNMVDELIAERREDAARD